MKAGRDFLIAALLVSAIIHVAVMIFAEPRVMTTVAAGIARGQRRGPMRVVEAAERPDPVAIEVVRDEDAVKEAPVADETIAVVPSVSASIPVPEARETESAAALPEFLSSVRPDESVPKIEISMSEKGVAADVRMTLDTPPIGVRSDDRLEIGDFSKVSAVGAPVFEAPVFSAVAPSVAVTKIRRTESNDDSQFKPIDEVLEKVDENVVKLEKEAVKELLDGPSALDMTEAVDARLFVSSFEGYTYFKAVLSPKAKLPAVPKDLVVLIDASGSIGSDRLGSCRQAAKRILRSAMNTGDRFNLVAFRDRFTYAFRSWRGCDAASFAAGDRWLSDLSAFGRTDVFGTISSVLTLPRDPTRPLIALVVTDGDANEGVSDNAAMLREFAALNDGLVSVYMYGVKSSANVDLIDSLTRSNRGESFIFGGWRWSAGEDLEKLSERFRDPLITDLRIVFASGLDVNAYPTQLKNLYRGNSVEVIGRVKGAPKEIAFSLKGLSGSSAYEGYYRLPLANAAADAGVRGLYEKECKIDERIR